MRSGTATQELWANLCVFMGVKTNSWSNDLDDLWANPYELETSKSPKWKNHQDHLFCDLMNLINKSNQAQISQNGDHTIFFMVQPTGL